MQKPTLNSEPTSRREFLRRSAQGAALAGAGTYGLLGFPEDAAAANAGGRTLDKAFDYDISKLRQTDPKLIQFEETGNIAAGVKKLRAISVGMDDRVFVSGERVIRVFDKAGTKLREISCNDNPRCLAVAADGSVYAGVKDRVEVFDDAGKRKAQWDRAGKDAVLTSIAVTENDVFVADAGGRIVLRYDRAGKLVKQIGKRDAARNIPGFIIPSPYFDLAVGRDGVLWVANTGRHRLEAYTFDGEFELAWGEPSMGIKGFCGCCNPIHFAFMPDGRFVTAEKGLVRVKVYSAKGEFDCVVAGAESFPKHTVNPTAAAATIDVAVDSAGRVLVADPLAGAVRIFTAKKKA